MVNVDVIKSKIEGLDAEVAKLEGGNKSSAARVRAILQDIKNACLAGRKDAMEIKSKV